MHYLWSGSHLKVLYTASQRPYNHQNNEGRKNYEFSSALTFVCFSISSKYDSDI